MATESNLVTAAEHNFFLYAGDSWACELIFTDKATNTPIDLTGSALRLQIKARKTDSQAVTEFTSGSGLEIGGAGSNVVTIDGSNNALPGGTYFYDLQAVKGGLTTTYLKGIIKVEEDVTR